MDENEWLRSDNPLAMLAHVRGRIDERKQRLFACACVRSVWNRLGDERFRAIVELSEECADGRATLERLEEATRQLSGSRVDFSDFLNEPSVSAMVAGRAVGHRSVALCIDGAVKAVRLSAAPCGPGERENIRRPDHAGMKAHDHILAEIFRDIAGNPFRPVILDPDWLAWDGGIVRRLAETMYEERRYQDLPVLADALEEAGCDVPEVLDHLRERGVHARGCWALDLARGA